jgi:hypothetical protein
MKAGFIVLLALTLEMGLATAGDLAGQFAAPPDSARPWVYWFWNNGNVNKQGITADLEAMKRAGIGGVIIMDVVERFAPPPGDADFMSVKWQELFDFAVSEAHRLGLKINMTNGPGWCGSSGPWITPALSMQKLVSTNLTVEGPADFSGLLPRPDTDNQRWRDTFASTVKYPDFYEDVAVLAYPLTQDGSVQPAAVQNLTPRLGADGRLNWKVPAGQWIILRIGHTSTGSSTRPPVKGGNGLECDKLSREAMDVHFDHMMRKLISQTGKDGALVATHIDSWEVGSQNWTPKLREEFEKRRGYDPLPFLPDIISSGRSGTAGNLPVGDPAVAKRFRWDFDETIAELLAENYVGRLAELAHEHGLRLTLEGYDLPFGDEATYTQRADEPMTEFWATGGSENEAKGRQMASVAHVMGEDIVGAEAFTSGDSENWKFTPATIKALGDYEFCQGVNRFVIHRYAFQPYLDRYPGSTMGPWGLHYERTQTWWEMSGAWHKYLARCQFTLRQGQFVADLLYLRPELPNQTYFHPDPAPPVGYKYDEISAEALIKRVEVKAGRLVLPDGMSYRLLVLPTGTRLMTPELVQKLKQLAAAGATMVGPSPTASPSLTDYPKCDTEVAELAAEVWGDCDGKTTTEHAFKRGKVIWGQPLDQVLKGMATQPDFTSSVKLNWIHRRLGDTQIYFVANESAVSVEAECTFRVNGLRPELWNPQTGEITPLALYQETAAGIRMPLRLEGSGSTFVVFREPAKSFDAVVNFTRDGQPVLTVDKPPAIRILSATYGVPGDARRTRDVLAKVQSLVDRGDFGFQVSKMAEGDDPAFGTVKTLTLQYTVNGQAFTISGQDPEQINLSWQVPAAVRPADLVGSAGGRVQLIAAQPGHYEITRASGRTESADVKTVASPQEIGGPWNVKFPPKWGAPPEITLDHLISLSDSPIEGVKYFSGTATYERAFDWQPGSEDGNQKSEYWLDLGEVQVMARVNLNGRDLGILWKKPFRIDVTAALEPGQNHLQIQVADLWPNRMIGDAALPETKRFTWSSYEPFNTNSPLPESGLLGPVRIVPRPMKQLD